MLPTLTRGQYGKVYVSAIDPRTAKEITPTSATALLIREGGTSTIATGTVSAITSSRLEAAFTLTPEATYTLGRYYIKWSITHTVTPSGGSPTSFVWVQIQRIEITKYEWRRPIASSLIAAKYPYLSNVLPAGSTFETYMVAAWERLGSMLYARKGIHAGSVWYPELFAEALEFMTVADIYRVISLHAGSEDSAKSREFDNLSNLAIVTACSYTMADEDDSGTPEASTMNAIQFRR